MLVPFQTAPEPPMTPELRDACRRAMHVLTADGKLLRAGKAALFVLRRTTPFWRAFSYVFSLPPLSWAAELGYLLVARNRRFFAKLLFRGRKPPPPP